MMNRATRVRNRGTYPDIGSALTAIECAGDAAIVLRGRPRWFIIGCPDGCGDKLPVNLDPRAGRAWRLDESSLSVYPSVWRDTGCESHFIVWRGRIWWGLDWEEEYVRPELEDTILGLLGTRRAPSDPLTIAQSLNEDPWVVMAACNRLYRRGQLRRERGADGVSFVWDPRKADR